MKHTLKDSLVSSEYPDYEPNLNRLFQWDVAGISGDIFRISKVTGNITKYGLRSSHYNKAEYKGMESGRGDLGGQYQGSLWEVPTVQKEKGSSVVISIGSGGEVLFYCLLCHSYI